MRIALVSDEPYRVHHTLESECARRGHQVVPWGACKTGAEVPWPVAAEEAALAVTRGDCQEGIFLCWTGTGISMAANKVPGIRAALCFDPGMAAGARTWNHANVLCLSNRLLSDDMAKEILAAWFDTPMDGRGAAGVQQLAGLDAKYRR